jgi:hypothetical protein
MPYKNIDPTIWGPHLWKFMHYFTLSYPEEPTEEDKDNLYNFFNTIQTVLPCEKCRYNFKSHLEKTPLTEEILSNNINVIRWLFDIHNEVNKTTNKPVLSYDDFIKIYSTKSQEVQTLQETKPIEVLKPIEVVKPIDIKEKDIKEKDIKRKDIKDNKITNKLQYVFEYGKNNTVVIVMLIIILILLIIYINKKY